MIHVMIVDDEAQIAHGIAALLPCEELGIGAVHVAFSAAEALEKLADAPIGIVLTDIRMPDNDGIFLLKTIKERWKRTKVIMLTGYADFDYAKEALQGQATDYLLKPVRKDTLAAAVGKAMAQLRQEWEEVASAQRAMRTLRAYEPELKAKLLADLIAGFRLAEAELTEKLVWHELPFRRGDSCILLLVRPEQDASALTSAFAALAGQPDLNDAALLAYGLENIAQETFSDDFHFWCCRDVHGHLVFLVKPLARVDDSGAAFALRDAERCAVLFHKHAGQFLHVDATVYMSDPGEFPARVPDMYERTLAAIRGGGSPAGQFLVKADEVKSVAPDSLRCLHEPPQLRHLFEIGDWHAIEDKLNRALTQADVPDGAHTERLAEIYFTFTAALCTHLHKRGRRLAEFVGTGLGQHPESALLWTPGRLKSWMSDTLDQLRQLGDERTGGRSEAIIRLQQFVAERLSEDLSLQRMADYVYMHPTHLSKIYKKETGEGISEYLTRLRMERAAQLLGSTDVKIYEIGCKTGYMNANYFIKVFRKQFGVTPQEYRERLRRDSRGD